MTSSYLNVYREGSSFKTIKIQSSTTVAEVVKMALIKLSLEVRKEKYNIIKIYFNEHFQAICNYNF